ncbi:hypothetical protein V2J09_017940 [Rumex salicifolius]
MSKGPTCYEDIRIVDGIVYPTNKEACYALGLLDDEKEYIDGIMKARSMTMPDNDWESTWRVLSNDILAYQRRILRIKEIEKLLHKNDSSLKIFPSMSQHDKSLNSHGLNKIIQDELQYDREELIHEQ